MLSAQHGSLHQNGRDCVGSGERQSNDLLVVTSHQLNDNLLSIMTASHNIIKFWHCPRAPALLVCKSLRCLHSLVSGLW